jgi:hypothetical protein
MYVGRRYKNGTFQFQYWTDEESWETGAACSCMRLEQEGISGLPSALKYSDTTVSV